MQEHSFLSKVVRLLKNRPGYLFRAGRGYILFLLARVCRALLPMHGVVLGSNVRFQRCASLMAESPHARISVESDSIIYEDARLEAYRSGAISIGASSIIGGAKIISRYRIQIGHRFLCSWDVFIQDYDSHPVSATQRRRQVEHMVSSFRPSFAGSRLTPTPPPDDWDFPGEEIVIGNDVWVGAGATILKGAHIGDGSIVATGAVVLRGEYPAYSLIAGNPANVVKSLEQSSPGNIRI